MASLAPYHSIVLLLPRLQPAENGGVWPCDGRAIGDWNLAMHARPSRGHAHQTCVALLRCATIRVVVSATQARVAPLERPKLDDAARFVSIRSCPATLLAPTSFAAPGIISTHPCPVSVVSKPPTTALSAQPGRRTWLAACICHCRSHIVIAISISHRDIINPNLGIPHHQLTPNAPTCGPCTARRVCTAAHPRPPPTSLPPATYSGGTGHASVACCQLTCRCTTVSHALLVVLAVAEASKKPEMSKHNGCFVLAKVDRGLSGHGGVDM